MHVLQLVLCLGVGSIQCAFAAEAFRAAAPDSCAATRGTAFFYHSRDFGSDRLIHPLRLILNGGFGIMQLDNVDNHILEVPYGTGLRNVWRNITSPLPAIEAVGWRTFLLQEVMPLNFDRDTARYWPNYMNHLLGGGMSYRMMTEWYESRGCPVPVLWSAGTITVYHMLNEVVENGAYGGHNTDAIADLLIFDPLSMVLFSFDPVCRFFSETLHMNDWSYQTSYNPWRQTIENNGQSFVAKWRIPWSRRWSCFYHWGTHGEFGLSRTNDRGECWSFGAGLKAEDLVFISPGEKTVELVIQAGVFYDRENSLLASLMYSRSKDDRIRLNIYPGLVRVRGLDPGAFLGISPDGRVSVGVTAGSAPWVPFGVALGE
jgi:hypothetical protein